LPETISTESRVARGIYWTRYGWRFYADIDGRQRAKRLTDREHVLGLDELQQARSTWIDAVRRIEPPAGLPLPARFCEKVYFTRTCWVWVGATAKGYGRFWHDGRGVQAHVFAYESLRTKIPAGLEIEHTCRNRACVNPDHLEPVTHKVNVLRGGGITAVQACRTTCALGHPLEQMGGQRRCRICRSASITQARRRACACGCGEKLSAANSRPGADYLPFHRPSSSST
jgi:hypothetical protein